jgi:L-rhamnose-H+ transport protein
VIQANPILGVVLHAVGALCAATCFMPQKMTRGWSWQTYWLAMASVCWFILPVAGALITIPELWEVLRDSPSSAMLNAFVLGAFYGIGGTAFGLAIKHVGISLTYAVAIGISCILGTLLPPWISGELAAVLGRTGSGWVMAGLAIGAVGILLSGLSGRLKELDLDGRDPTFNLAKGLPLCVVAGVLSAVYGFSLAAGQPIADVAAEHGAGVFQGNVIYIFSNTGAFLSTGVYCLFLHFRHRTFGEYFELPVGLPLRSLPANFSLAVLTGLLWYAQFFFYGLGHVRMGDYKFSSWGIHMIMLVLFSSLAGLVLREWSGSRPRTWAALASALFVLILAVLAIAYGNYLGEMAAFH